VPVQTPCDVTGKADVVAFRGGVAAEEVDETPGFHSPSAGTHEASVRRANLLEESGSGHWMLRFPRSPGREQVAETEAVRLRGAFGTDDGFGAASGRVDALVALRASYDVEIRFFGVRLRGCAASARQTSHRQRLA